MQISENRPKGISDLLSAIYKWKKFLLINVTVVAVLSIVYSLLLTQTYRSTAMLMLPPESSGFGGLSNLLSGSGVGQLGAKLFGISGSNEDMILGVLYSRSSLTNAIEKFDLMDYYNISDDNMDKALKAFKDDIAFEPNEFGLFEISIIHEDPEKAAEIANYFVSLGDSLNIAINSENAHNNRIFLEKRYNQNLNDLKNAENKLNKYQKENGIFAPPEQLQVIVSAAASLESERIQKEILLNSLQNSLAPNSSVILQLKNQLRAIDKKIEELKNNPLQADNQNLLFGLKNAPDLLLEYYRLVREVEIQQKVLEFLYPVYEQAKVEEKKAVPTLIVIDEAVPPKLKYAPKRSFIVIGFVSLIGLLSLLIILRGEITANRESHYNDVLAAEDRFFNKLRKIYGLKF